MTGSSTTSRRAAACVVSVVVLAVACGGGDESATAPRAFDVPAAIEGLVVESFVEAESNARCTSLSGERLSEAQTLCAWQGHPPEVIVSFPADDDRSEFAFVYSLPVGTAIEEFSLNGRRIEPAAVVGHAWVMLVPSRITFDDEFTFGVSASGNVVLRCVQSGVQVDCDD